MRSLNWLTLTILVALLAPAAVRAETPRVVASIAPIQSLTAAVMAGVGTPALLVPATASEHEQTLKPSQSAELNQADLVIWVGDPLEGFLVKPLAALAKKGTVLTLLRADGIDKRDAREGGPWDDHDHDHGHAHGKTDDPIAELDGHIWLDPANAARIVDVIADRLIKLDPGRAAAYHANADKEKQALAALNDQLAAQLKPVAGVPFVVFHDAYQYAEKAYGLNAVGSITVDPERKPGPKRLTALRGRIVATGAVCVFSEPQHQPKLVDTVIEGTKARRGTLDPIGAGLTPGPEAYFQLMRNLSNSLTGCLSNKT